ncbi:MAG TPA: ABC transporter substrate-binding protein [Syntrophales bacterium]|nr:ABC transporter substrate-binding protein [Syntrophales bacterium]HQN78849.1 ABC transporter substrate-binding protein [Syntrophales bacterium]HQQ27974.1 ABC transporter substrate-binding protein [Syntrophales bacterium]
MKKIFGLAALSFLLLALAVPAVAEDTIKIAAMEPLSGSFKDIGERYLDGVVYAAKVINESGGLLGKKVEVIPVDSELKPDVATRKAQNLILRDNVKFFCGGTGSSVGAAMEQLAERQNAIMISYGMAAASMTGEKCSRNFFRTCGNTDQHSYALAALVAKKGYKRVAIIAQDYSFGQEALAAFKRRLAKLNPSAEIVAELYHPAGTKDFAPYVSQLIAAKPDAIFTPNWGNDLTLLLKQGRPMGMKQVVLSYYINDEFTIQAMGDDSLMIGNMGAEVYTLSIPTDKNKEFVAKFYKDKGYYPTWLRGKSFMSTMFWAEAVKKAGTTDIPAVIKAWEGLTYDGPAGLWTMRACDHQAQVPFWYTEIVKENPFFKHAFEASAGMVPAADVEVPCAETGCKMK